jgi:protocatechuate 3,4-dioxygenase beta subunit
VVKDVVVEALAPPQPLYLTLDAGGGVHGTLTDREGKPLRNVWIYARVHRAPGEPADSADNLLQVGDRSDSKGRYFLEGMAPGTYLIQLNMGSRGSVRAQVIVQGMETIRQNLQLMPTGSVLVRAVDEEGKPIKGVYFYFFDDQSQWLGWGRQTDQNGESLAQNLRMGPAVARAHHAKYETDQFDVIVRPDAQVTMQVTLRKKPEPE